MENLPTSRKKAGLIDRGFGLNASIADINRDGWPDIYIANDFNKPDFLYIQQPQRNLY